MVQLLPGGATVVAGCMDGVIQLLDLRCSARQQPAAAQVAWGQQAAAGAAEGGQRFWWRGRASSRLCAARCHENLLVAGGDAAAVSLHDLRMGGACFAELALPAGDGGSVRTPAVFAMDLLWPRLATGGDRGQVQVRLCLGAGVQVHGCGRSGLPPGP